MQSVRLVAEHSARVGLKIKPVATGFTGAKHGFVRAFLSLVVVADCMLAV